VAKSILWLAVWRGSDDVASKHRIWTLNYRVEPAPQDEIVLYAYDDDSPADGPTWRQARRIREVGGLLNVHLVDAVINPDENLNLRRTQLPPVMPLFEEDPEAFEQGLERAGWKEWSPGVDPRR
jgi:hypothetical protein